MNHRNQSVQDLRFELMFTVFPINYMYCNSGTFPEGIGDLYPNLHVEGYLTVLTVH